MSRMNLSSANQDQFRSLRNAQTHTRVITGMIVALVWFVSNLYSVTAVAGESFARPGLYVGLSGVFQTNPFEGEIEDLLQDEADPVDLDLTFEDSGGFSALLGYRLASFFAAELQYEFIDEYDIRAEVGPAEGKIYSLTGHTLTANGKFIAPIWRVQPYVLVGVGFSSFDVDRGSLAPLIEALDSEIDINGGTQTSFAGRLGLGIDLYLTENIVLNAQGQLVATTIETPDLGNIDDLNYTGFSAGLQYRF